MPKRIHIMGPPGSGKSTAAIHLATARGVPHIELDALFWLPNWVRRDNDDFCDQVDAATSAERWIASGTYVTRAQSLLWGRAEMVVWLDLPLRVTLPRIAQRAWGRWRSGELLWGTNRESFAKHFALWDPPARSSRTQ